MRSTRSALGQLDDDPSEAVATIEADQAPAARTLGFLALADALTDAQDKRRLELIDRAEHEARRVEEKESRLSLLRQVADRWLELGLVDRATPILRQGRAIIASLPRDRFSFAAEEFAEVLAVIDLRTAMTIFERKDPKNVSPTNAATIERHHGEAAVRLAAIDPAEAERLVPKVLPNFWGADRDDYVLRICQRMARADLPRARKILEGLNEPSGPDSKPRPELVAEGLALLAAERVETDPTGARKLLDEAFDRLRRVASEEHRGNDPQDRQPDGGTPAAGRADRSRSPRGAALVGGGLPRAAVRVRVRESVASRRWSWRRSSRGTTARWPRPSSRLPWTSCRAMLADGFGFSYQQSTVIKALAVYDPRAVTALVRDLPASARRAPAPRNGWQAASIDAQIRLAAAEALGLSVDERYWKVLGGHLGRQAFRRGRW